MPILRLIFLTAAVSLTICCAYPAYARGSGNDSIQETSHFLASYHGDPQVLHSSVISFGGRVDFIWPGIGLARISEISDRQAERLEHIPGIDRVLRDLSIRWVQSLIPEINVCVQADLDAIQINGENLHPQFLDKQWPLQRIHAAEAWKTTRGSSSVRIGILDSGISPDHMDLVGIYDLSRSRNLSESNRRDPLDFIDRHYHGTHISAIIASNCLGVAGIAPASTLVGVKVLDDNGDASFANIVAGIMYAVDDARVNIINLSIGGIAAGEQVRELAEMLRMALDYAESHGVLVVASAGNDGADLGSAALLPGDASEKGGVILVSATTIIDGNEVAACYSNFGVNLISISAPGGSADCAGDDHPATDCMVLSALAPAVARRMGLSRPEAWYVYESGTSMAAPLVTGVAALIRARNPGASPAFLAQRLAESADDLGLPGRDAHFGSGRINAARAVK